MSELVLVHVQDRVLHIEINRAQKKNALTQAMYAAMADALARADADPAVRAILLTGSGGVFSAGNDIADFQTNFALNDESAVVRFLHALVDANKPVIAAVEGIAIGIGTTLLLHCDLVYCGKGARFQLPFVNLGLVPEAGSSFLLPQLLGQRHAAALLLLGDMFDATAAQQSGIVNTIVDDGGALEAARATALTLAAKPPAALRLTKQLMKQGQQQVIRAAMRAESALFAQQLQSPEAAEALLAFTERRKPDFSAF